jgi:hypothetical protein
MRADIMRGWPLTVFLILVGLASLLSIAFYAGMYGITTRNLLPVWMVRTFLAVSILRFVATIAIWLWLRLGLVLYVVLTMVALPMTLSLGYRSTVFSLVGVALLGYLVRHKWRYALGGMAAKQS